MSEQNNNVSVLMATFNDEANVADAIESILKQSYQKFEFLILDDKSTDNTYEIIKNYYSKDARIKIFQNKNNIGLTKSLNFLISKSKGKYIARQDADDSSMVNRLQMQYELLENSKYIGCSTRAIVKNTNIKIPGISSYLPMGLLVKVKNPIIHGTLMIEKKVLNFLGNYDENFYYAQDYKLIYNLLKNSFSFKRLNSALYSLNMENNISSNYQKEQNYFADCVRKNINPILSRESS